MPEGQFVTPLPQQFEKIMKHKHLELQLTEAKLAQQAVAAAEDKENSLAERQYLLAETLEQQKRCEQLTEHEADLRGQLSLYSGKFEEFQEAHFSLETSVEIPKVCQSS